MIIGPEQRRDLGRRITRVCAQYPGNWKHAVDAEVHRWAEENMPMMPRPTVSVRVLKDEESGRHYAQIRFWVQPLYMDVTISQETL